MGVLKGICENAQPMESFKKGETICLALDEILDLIVLVSGSAATYMQVLTSLLSSFSSTICLCYSSVCTIYFDIQLTHQATGIYIYTSTCFTYVFLLLGRRSFGEYCETSRCRARQTQFTAD